jgi:hypothetical protein
VGELTVGLFLPLALVVAAVVAVIAIGVGGGLGLMFPTIAYEDSDGFDAISHSFSYTYARPWRLGFYVTVAFIYGAICYAFVRFFLFLVLWITYAFLQLGFVHRNAKLHAIWPAPRFGEFLTGHPTTTTAWATSASAWLVHLWILVIVGLMIAFVISFYFSAGTIIYALMRHRVDRVPLNDVYIAQDEIQAQPGSASPATDETSTKAKPRRADAPNAEAGAPE